METVISPETFNAGLMGIAALLTALTGWGAFMSGRKREAAQGPQMEIRGALIDGSAARSLQVSHERMTEALNRNTDAIEDAAAEMKRCADATEASSKAVASVTSQIQRMTDELIRGQR